VEQGARPEKLLAGQIGKPHGVRGEVYLVPISDDPRRFAPGSRLFHENGRELVVSSARRHRDRYLIAFHGIESRDDAEGLRGALYVDAADLRELEEGEFWTRDIIGLEVFGARGERVGTVTDVRPGSAQDLLVVETDRGQRLVPMVAEIVTGVDVEGGQVTIDPPAGLLD
jgi:16S rRNA processing protein RimM